MPDLGEIARLFEEGKQLHEKTMPRAGKRDKMLAVLSREGGLTDQVRAAVRLCQGQPGLAIPSIEFLFEHLHSKSKKASTFAALALKEIYSTQVFAEKRSLQSFRQLANSNPPLSPERLASAFREHRAKELYLQFIKSLEQLLAEELVYFKKQVLQVLVELLGF